jgi:hypothetical protein
MLVFIPVFDTVKMQGEVWCGGRVLKSMCVWGVCVCVCEVGVCVYVYICVCTYINTYIKIHVYMYM